MENEIERILISEEQINARLTEMGKEIAAEYDGKNPLFVGILKGVVVFFSDMIRKIPIDCEIDFMAVSSYKGTKSTGNVTVLKDLSVDISGRHVVILEDILDSGLTLSRTMELLRTRNPASIKLVTFLDKHECRKVPIEADYVGFTIPNAFVVGYGLDYDERLRNLPYVGILKPEVYSK